MPITESILDTIKKMLGIPADDLGFDEDIIVNINSSFMFLNQLGIGGETPFAIEDSIPTWTDFDADLGTYQTAKSYIYLQVKSVFDPAPNSFTQDALKSQADEMAWRLVAQRDLKLRYPPEPEV